MRTINPKRLRAAVYNACFDVLNTSYNNPMPLGAVCSTGKEKIVYHASNEKIDQFKLDNVKPDQIYGVYFSKSKGTGAWGNRKYLHSVDISSANLAPSEVAKEIYLDEMGKGKGYGKRASERLQEMGYDGADLGKHELVIWNTAVLIQK